MLNTASSIRLGANSESATMIFQLLKKSFGAINSGNLMTHSFTPWYDQVLPLDPFRFIPLEMLILSLHRKAT